MRRYKRLYIFLGTVFSLSSLAYFYKDDLIRWSCHEENNSASCFILGKNLIEEFKPELAKSYFQKSCSAGYKDACTELNKLPK